MEVCRKYTVKEVRASDKKLKITASIYALFPLPPKEKKPRGGKRGPFRVSSVTFTSIFKRVRSVLALLCTIVLYIYSRGQARLFFSPSSMWPHKSSDSRSVNLHIPIVGVISQAGLNWTNRSHYPIAAPVPPKIEIAQFFGPKVLFMGSRIEVTFDFWVRFLFFCVLGVVGWWLME